MIKVGVIGFGYWGKVLYHKLIKICHIDFVCRRNDNYLEKLSNVDWVIVATPNETHYQIVANCLKFGINVFCEKPLTLTKKKSDKLYKLAEKYNVNLYVSDVQYYTGVDCSFLQHNVIRRLKDAKKSNYQTKDLLYRLAYHDIYFLYKHIGQYTIKDIFCLSCNNKLQFKLVFDNNVDINFLYDVEYKKGTEHYINGSNMRKELTFDPLHKMLKKVLYGQVDWQYNKEITLFTNDVIDKINEKI